MCNLKTFGIFTVLDNHHHIVSKHFLHPKRKPLPIKQSFPIHFSLALGNNLPSVFMSLSILDISYKWNHTICELLCLCLT
jgi:hypothetical protein